MDVSQALIYTVIVPSRECNIELKLRLSTVDSRPFQVVYRSLDGPSGSSLITQRWPGGNPLRTLNVPSFLPSPEKGKRDTAPHNHTEHEKYSGERRIQWDKRHVKKKKTVGVL